MNSIDTLNAVNEGNFEHVSTTIGRTTKACYNHWKLQILPILKTHILGLPQGVEWMHEFLVYMVNNKITDTKTIEYNRLVEELFPGQTSLSLSMFANNINNNYIRVNNL